LASYLFTYPDRPHRRERLAYLFWPNLDQQRARGALNSAIWRVRKILAGAPETGNDSKLRTTAADVLLEPEGLDIDALALQRAANWVSREPRVLTQPAVLEQLIGVLSRYEGPFLDGDDGDWILEEREKLHSIFVRMSIQVVRHLGVDQRYTEAIDLARSALRFDPYREELVRMLFGLLALNEQRVSAIREYEKWRNFLETELGIAPLPTTRALLDEIRHVESDQDFHSLRARLFGS
jgi:DNA-binding SARP family transcriptional activator